MIYCHKTMVNASIIKVAQFHHNASNMSKITPPPIVVRFQHAPSPIYEGAEMDFKLWFGPFPLRWRARFEAVSPNGFIDRQISGPYKTWVHLHTFKDIGGDKTEIVDEIQAEFQTTLLWRLMGMLIWSGMPVLFAYRAWKTERELSALE